jgi:hypothetical protein
VKLLRPQPIIEAERPRKPTNPPEQKTEAVLRVNNQSASAAAKAVAHTSNHRSRAPRTTNQSPEQKSEAVLRV